MNVIDRSRNYECLIQPGTEANKINGVIKTKYRRSTFYRRYIIFPVALICLLLSGGLSLNAQVTTSSVSPYMTQGNNFSPGTSQNYLKNSAAFRQEIMRMEINVVRGARSLPITQVPRVQKNDVIKMKIVDEAVGGIRPSESLYDWTFLVAFVNPNRRAVPDGDGMDKKGSAVSQEIRFKKTGWYKQYSFQVPYDSQPVFFLYPKANYRSKILKVVSQNYNEVRKLGDKTIEIAGAYSQISNFLNELQYTLYQTQTSRYYNMNGVLGFGGGTMNVPPNGATGAGNTYNPYGSTNGSTYNPYGSTSTYNPYGTASTYNPYGSTYNPYGTPTPMPTPGTRQIDVPVNYSYLVEQSIERMARAFNLQLPSCWGGGSSGYSPYGGSSYGSSYGGSTYGSTYGGSTYGNTYGSTYGSSYGSYGGYGGYGNTNQNNFGYAVSQELFSRAQCVAKNIRLEDFDLSVASMLQQGGIMLASHLRDKYPQLAYWINLAAAAIDFIVKVFQKAALKIVPTIVQASDGGGNSANYTGGAGSTYQTSYAAQSGYTTNYNSSSGSSGSTYSSGAGGYSPTGGSTVYTPSPSSSAASQSPPVKLALYAESQPDNMQFVTAYPVVVHKWQQEPDPEVISIPPPVLAEPCLHAGVNILKNTMIGDEPEADTFTKDFKLTMSAASGFKKEFPLKKNIGLGGWELNLSKEDLASFPKIRMTLESVISGTRGFNEITSPSFVLPLNLGGSYELKPESQKAFSVGGKRFVTLTNPLGGCQCLQAVIYKPSFGGQFVYEANAKDRSNQLQYSPDGREVSFEIDASSFQPGAGQLILYTYGGEQTQLNIKLYPLPPNVTNVKMARGDNQAVISGERLEQLVYVKINGRRATVVGGSVPSQSNSAVTNGYPNQSSSYPNGSQPGYPSQPLQNTPNGSQPGYPNAQQSYPGSSQPGYPNPVPPGYPNVSVQQTGQTSPQFQSTQGNQASYPNQSQIPTANSQTSVPPQTPSDYPNGGSVTFGNQSNPSSQPMNQQANQSNNYSSVQLGANERLVVFDDTNAKLAEPVINLELGLEDDRTLPFSRSFPAAPSRPSFVADASREIEAQVSDVETPKQTDFDLKALAGAVMPVETNGFAISLRNALTDYDFKVENLSVETRLEKSNSGANNSTSFGGFSNPGYANSYGGETIKTAFEVLDWKNLRLDFTLSEQMRKTLGGRRIQFRIRDRDRGDSDWYTVKQTFVRIPEIESVVCKNEMEGKCELTGASIDYIAQISVDGGASWYPGDAGGLQTQPLAEGLKKALIPAYTNKKLLFVKLRDYPQMNGLLVSNYTFVNTVKAASKIGTRKVKAIDPKSTQHVPRPVNQQPKAPVQNIPAANSKGNSSSSVQAPPNMKNFPGMPGYNQPPKPETSVKNPNPPVSRRKPAGKKKL